jgi:hypothetical protein
LAKPLDTFTVSLQLDTAAVFLSAPEREAWALYHFEPMPGYVGAVAAPGQQHVCRGYLLEA